MSFEELRKKIDEIIIHIRGEPEENLPFNKITVSKNLIKFIVSIEEYEKNLNINLKLPESIKNDCFVINEYLDSLRNVLKK